MTVTLGGTGVVTGGPLNAWMCLDSGTSDSGPPQPLTPCPSTTSTFEAQDVNALIPMWDGGHGRYKGTRSQLDKVPNGEQGGTEYHMIYHSQCPDLTSPHVDVCIQFQMTMKVTMSMIWWSMSSVARHVKAPDGMFGGHCDTL